MAKLLEYSAVDDPNSTEVMIDKIVRLSKSLDNEITYIHLINGEVLESNDSIRTLSARINLSEQ